MPDQQTSIEPVGGGGTPPDYPEPVTGPDTHVGINPETGGIEITHGAPPEVNQGGGGGNEAPPTVPPPPPPPPPSPPPVPKETAPVSKPPAPDTRATLPEPEIPKEAKPLSFIAPPTPSSNQPQPAGALTQADWQRLLEREGYEDASKVNAYVVGTGERSEDVRFGKDSLSYQMGFRDMKEYQDASNMGLTYGPHPGDMVPDGSFIVEVGGKPYRYSGEASRTVTSPDGASVPRSVDGYVLSALRDGNYRVAVKSLSETGEKSELTISKEYAAYLATLDPEARFQKLQSIGAIPGDAQFRQDKEGRPAIELASQAPEPTTSEKEQERILNAYKTPDGKYDVARAMASGVTEDYLVSVGFTRAQVAEQKQAVAWILASPEQRFDMMKAAGQVPANATLTDYTEDGTMWYTVPPDYVGLRNQFDKEPYASQVAIVQAAYDVMPPDVLEQAWDAVGKPVYREIPKTGGISTGGARLAQMQGGGKGGVESEVTTAEMPTLSTIRTPEGREVVIGFDALPTDVQNSILDYYSTLTGRGKLLDIGDKHFTEINMPKGVEAQLNNIKTAVGLVPVLGTVALWNDMPAWMQGVSIASDLLAVLPARVIGKAADALIMGARTLGDVRGMTTVLKATEAGERDTVAMLRKTVPGGQRIVEPFQDAINAQKDYMAAALRANELQETLKTTMGEVRPELERSLVDLQTTLPIKRQAMEDALNAFRDKVTTTAPSLNPSQFTKAELKAIEAYQNGAKFSQSDLQSAITKVQALKDRTLNAKFDDTAVGKSLNDLPKSVMRSTDELLSQISKTTQVDYVAGRLAKAEATLKTAQDLADRYRNVTSNLNSIRSQSAELSAQLAAIKAPHTEAGVAEAKAIEDKLAGLVEAQKQARTEAMRLMNDANRIFESAGTMTDLVKERDYWKAELLYSQAKDYNAFTGRLSELANRIKAAETEILDITTEGTHDAAKLKRLVELRKELPKLKTEQATVLRQIKDIQVRTEQMWPEVTRGGGGRTLTRSIKPLWDTGRVLGGGVATGAAKELTPAVAGMRYMYLRGENGETVAVPMPNPLPVNPVGPYKVWVRPMPKPGTEGNRLAMSGVRTITLPRPSPAPPVVAPTPEEEPATVPKPNPHVRPYPPIPKPAWPYPEEVPIWTRTYLIPEQLPKGRVQEDASTRTRAETAARLAQKTGSKSNVATSLSTVTKTAGGTSPAKATAPATASATSTATQTATAARTATQTATATQTKTKIPSTIKTGKPVIPETPKVPKKPVKLVGRGKKKGGSNYQAIPDGSWAWKQGLFWKYIPPPWNQSKPTTLPRGVVPLGAKKTHLRTPQETLQIIGSTKNVPKSISIDLGVEDVFIEDGTITFRGGGQRRNVGQRIDSTTQGMSIPAVAAEDTSNVTDRLGWTTKAGRGMVESKVEVKPKPKRKRKRTPQYYVPPASLGRVNWL